jgi:hypothetical protein
MNEVATLWFIVVAAAIASFVFGVWIGPRRALTLGATAAVFLSYAAAVTLWVGVDAARCWDCVDNGDIKRGDSLFIVAILFGLPTAASLGLFWLGVALRWVALRDDAGSTRPT